MDDRALGICSGLTSPPASICTFSGGPRETDFGRFPDGGFCHIDMQVPDSEAPSSEYPSLEMSVADEDCTVADEL